MRPPPNQPGDPGNPGGSDGSTAALYFVADDGAHGDELWRTDGTDAGTMMVKDINIGSALRGYGPSELTVFNGALYFQADDGVHGQELWKSDGIDTGTMMVKDINPAPTGDGPFALTVFNGALYFEADDGVHGREVWKSSGTDTGTLMVKDINSIAGAGSGYGLGRVFTVLNGALVFEADDGVNGRELWKTDGTEANTRVLKDICPGPCNGIWW